MRCCRKRTLTFSIGNNMKTFRSLLINCLIIVLLVSPVAGVAAPPPPTPIAPSIDPVQRQAIEQAVSKAVQAEAPGRLYFMIYDVKVDRIELSADNSQGLAWLVPVDPRTGQAVPTEPAVAVVDLPSPQSAWQATLPTDSTYKSAVASLPKALLSRELQESVLTNPPVSPLSTEAFTGYKLPWEGGKGKYLSGSIGHFLIYYSCSITACRYAYDFYDGTRFALEASKGGTVWSYFDGWPNDDHTSGHTNYIVLRDPTTSPVSYQLYYHLTQGSIPAALKQVGAVVNQGDFIGNADNTGYSTGNHLHFMVYADPTTPGSSWGNSVDFIFSDVTVNGGHPRTQYEAQTFPSYGTQYMPGDLYISGNRGATPPTGALTAPAAWTVVTGPTVTVSGQGWDNVSVTNLQVVADYDGTWKALSPLLTANPFTTTIDLCAAGIPDGPVTLGLWVWDNEGTRTLFAQTPRPIVKNYSCQPPPPTCTITADQVALFSLPDFQGNCSVFTTTGGINNSGIYDTSRLGPVGDKTTASIMVGTNVQATVFDSNYTNGIFSGRAESFDSSDAGLEDNRVGVSHVSSLFVWGLIPPNAPALNNPPKVQISQPLTAKDSVLLTWTGGEGGTAYQVELTNLGNNTKTTSDWIPAMSWSAGSLAAGSYSWKVTARNRVGSTSSNPVTFTVAAGSLPNPTTRTAPYGDSMQNGVSDWVSSGLWRQSSSNATGEDASNIFWIANTSNGGSNPSDGSYSSSTVFGSDLTSPPISIPTGPTNYLRFREYYHTESPATFWDQRLVQISANGGPFQDVYQMKDDPMDWWVYSSFINLSAYAGMTIRIRFHFDTVDSYDNNYAGWRIDDVTVNTNYPDTSYAEGSPNDTPAQAIVLTMNSTVNGYICPVGDLEYYAVSVYAGETVNFDIDAQSLSPASSLDTYIYLLDTDGKSVIAENDDEVPWVVRDSLLTYTFHRSGKYYLKVKSWSYPGSSVQSYACKNYFYTLKVYGGIQPTVTLTTPGLPWIGKNVTPITAQVTDGGSGMVKVDFLWHSPDWANDTWQLLGSDTNGSDGWSALFDPTTNTVNGSALLVRATNRAGLTRTVWIPSLQSDITPPSTRLVALAATTASTVIPLSWTASDAASGINYMEIQVQDITAGTGWQPWNVTFASNVRSALYEGIGGHAYGFTVHGIDNVGNVESYDPNPETTTTIASTCTPDSYDLAQPSDSNATSAAQLLLGEVQQHNFCPAGDVDWVSITVPKAGGYLVRWLSLSGGAAGVVDVYTPDTQTLLASGHSPALGIGVDLKFIAPTAGTYKIRVSPSNPGLWGSSMVYSIQVEFKNWVYLPSIKK
jgi:murein DD-endopeptidase MepM/ murein hydrolase activator NlpD